MQAQTLTPSEESKLLDGIKTAVDLVDNQSMSPNDALEKVARDLGWTPGWLRAGVSAFNNGRQLAQWNANDNVLDKLASFELADYDAIHGAIWGGSVKEAMDAYTIPISTHPDYDMPPQWLDAGREKRALDLSSIIGERQSIVPDQEHQNLIDKEASDRKMRHAWSEHNMAKRAFEEARSRHSHANDLVGIRVKLLENYFKKLAMDREDFATVDHAVGVYFGSSGKALMNHLAGKFPREKRAADSGRYFDGHVDLNYAPYTMVKSAIEAAQDLHRAKAAMDQAEAKMQKAAEDLRPFALAPQIPSEPDPLSPSLMPGSEKRANLGFMGASAVGAGTKALLDKALGPGGKREAIEDQWLELEDPNHEDELRKIQTQAMLSSMMSDPENPIAGYDAEQVLNAYNEISQLAPRAAAQPAALQPLLAKKLAGNLEPFEVREITDLEKGLRETKAQTPSTTRLINDAPESLLG